MKPILHIYHDRAIEFCCSLERSLGPINIHISGN